MFDRLKLHYIKNQEKGMPDKYGFKFTKNAKTSILYTYNQGIYEDWKKELEPRCVLHSFQEKYKIEKLIGKGTFGKVCLFIFTISYRI